MDLYDEFATLLGAFEAKRVDYAVCGGLAMAIHGFPRATVDVDFLIPQTALGPALACAHDLGYTIPADPMRLADGAVEIRRVTKIDASSHDLLSLALLLVTPAVEQVWKDRILVRWDPGELWVVSRRGLASLKRLRGSGQDLDDIKRLESDNP